MEEVLKTVCDDFEAELMEFDGERDHARVRSHKPAVQPTEEGGWNVHFGSQFWWEGCTAMTPLLFKHTVVISPEYQITFEPTRS
jgi:hypothetical protein